MYVKIQTVHTRVCVFMLCVCACMNACVCLCALHIDVILNIFLNCRSTHEWISIKCIRHLDMVDIQFHSLHLLLSDIDIVDCKFCIFISLTGIMPEIKI